MTELLSQSLSGVVTQNRWRRRVEKALTKKCQTWLKNAEAEWTGGVRPWRVSIFSGSWSDRANGMTPLWVQDTLHLTGAEAATVWSQDHGRTQPHTTLCLEGYLFNCTSVSPLYCLNIIALSYEISRINVFDHLTGTGIHNYYYCARSKPVSLLVDK